METSIIETGIRTILNFLTVVGMISCIAIPICIAIGDYFKKETQQNPS